MSVLIKPHEMTALMMIVDDDVDDIDYFVDSLHEIMPEVSCISAQGVTEALQMMETLSQQPDYIFIDLNMPKLNGKELIREIRKEIRYPSIKLIVYSTSKLEKDEVECRKLGANDFIKKPSSFAEFKDIMLRIIKV